MISKASKHIVKWLLHTGAISIEDRELYEYAAYSFLFEFIPFILVSAIGVILGMFIEGMLMILPFILIRKFSGGFHLDSAAICLVLSTLLLFLLLIFAKYITTHNYIILYSLLVVGFSAQIFILSPIDSAARKISSTQRIVFRKIARIILIIVCTIYFVLYALGLENAASSIGAGIILTGILQLPCIVVKTSNS